MSKKYTPTEWVANKTVATADVMNNIEVGINLSHDRLDDIDAVLNATKILMPTPSTVEENTRIFQEYLDLAKKNDTKLTIAFRDGVYELNSCVIYSNTHIELSQNTKLVHIRTKYTNPEDNSYVDFNPFLLNAEPYKNLNILEYKGNGNIKVTGGTIDAYCAFVFVHGKNIEVDGVRFINTKSDHVFQIGACNNVKISNCEFYGLRSPASNRNYVELIQLDFMEHGALPYWISTSNIYDNTVNDGVIIDGCKFYRGESTYDYLQVGIGSHGSTTLRNKNIKIVNNEFNGFRYAGVTIRFMDNVYVENNLFITDVSTNCIFISNSENVIINNNTTKGGSRSVYCLNTKYLNIDNLLIEDVVATSDYVFIGESNACNLNNLTLKNCSGGGYNVLLRSVTNCSLTNSKDLATSCANDVFVRVYTKDSNESKNIVVKNIQTDKTDLLVSDGTNIINDSVYETLFEGSATSGAINLTDSFDKFYDHRIVLNLYGHVDKELIFVNNKCTIRDFNLADDSSNTNIYFIEILISKSGTSTLNIDKKIQVNLVNGTASHVDCPVPVLKVYAKRKRY